MFPSIVIQLVISALVLAQLHPAERAQYQRLPSLKERARIQDEWKDERMASIPSLLEKYGADVWLVCPQNTRKWYPLFQHPL